MKSWINISAESDFSIYNIPFGIFSIGGDAPRLGIAIGEQILDLAAAAKKDIFKGINFDHTVLSSCFLNDFISFGKSVTSAIRIRVQEELCNEDSSLRNADGILFNQADATMHLPVRVGDYTDFYSSIEHATNLGKLFRDPDNALLPNWRHLPVGYHGRSSSIIISGQDIYRPSGQTKPNDGPPVYGPSKRLDFELEMAFIVGKSTEIGNRVSTKNAADHIFGMVLFNDWSARDIQKWEYVPLGPFLGKSFASSISPWVVTMEALDFYKVAGPKQEPEVLDYLKYTDDNNYDVNLEVSIMPEGSKDTVVSKSNYKYMYWNQAQQLAHHTVNGCNINVGDMMASGTISGKDEHSYGSLLEITQGGKKTMTLDGGEERKFIEDGDTVTIKGYCVKAGRRIGFGKVSAKVLPTK